MFQLARKAGIIVSLDGQGADELLAGYEGYPSAYIHSLLDQHRYLEIFVFFINGYGGLDGVIGEPYLCLYNPWFPNLSEALLTR